MRHVVAALVSLVVLLMAAVGTASADPKKDPTTYLLQCGNDSYTVVSPEGQPVGFDVTGTHLIIEARPERPTAGLTFCTVSFDGEVVFDGLFLITPAN